MHLRPWFFLARLVFGFVDYIGVSAGSPKLLYIEKILFVDHHSSVNCCRSFRLGQYLYSDSLGVCAFFCVATFEADWLLIFDDSL